MAKKGKQTTIKPFTRRNFLKLSGMSSLGLLLSNLPAHWIGGVYAMLGDKKQALAWLRRAVALGNHNYPWFQRDKNWDKLRGDAEFQRIMLEVQGYWKHYNELFGHPQS